MNNNEKQNKIQLLENCYNNETDWLESFESVSDNLRKLMQNFNLSNDENIKEVSADYRVLKKRAERSEIEMERSDFIDYLTNNEEYDLSLKLLSSILEIMQMALSQIENGVIKKINEAEFIEEIPSAKYFNNIVILSKTVTNLKKICSLNDKKNFFYFLADLKNKYENMEMIKRNHIERFGNSERFNEFLKYLPLSDEEKNELSNFDCFVDKLTDLKYNFSEFSKKEENILRSCDEKLSFYISPQYDNWDNFLDYLQGSQEKPSYEQLLFKNFSEQIKKEKDYTKYKFKICDANTKNFNNYSFNKFSKRQLPTQVFEYLISNDILKEKDFDIFSTNQFGRTFEASKGDILSEQEMQSNIKNLKRYNELSFEDTNIDFNGKIYISTEWDKKSINNFIKFINKKYSKYIKIIDA